MTVTDALGAEAAPATFRHGTETYTIVPAMQVVKSAIEQELRQRAYEDLYPLRGRMPDDQYADALKTIARDRRAYAYMGPVFWDYIATEDGAVMMVRLIFGTSEAKARKLIEDRGPDVQAVVEEMVLASMPPAMQQAARQRMQEKLGERANGAPPANPPRPA